MLCLGSFELYSRWVPLTWNVSGSQKVQNESASSGTFWDENDIYQTGW